MSKMADYLLIPDSNPIPVIPLLAELVGVNSAIILQQVHYWCETNRKNKAHFHDGYYWTYGTYAEWAAQFSWMGESTIRANVGKLEKQGLIVTGNYNRHKYDHTKWYRVDKERLTAILAEQGETHYLDIQGDKEVDILQDVGKPSAKNEQTVALESSRTIPETTQRLLINKKECKVETPNGDSDEKFSLEDDDFIPMPTFPEVEKNDNVFSRTVHNHGKKDAEWALCMIDRYIDEFYPKHTRRTHPTLNKPQRMAFAEKFLDFVNYCELSGQEPRDILISIINDRNIPDPTILIATSPKVMGNHGLRTGHVIYDVLRPTEYCPAEDYF